MISDLRLQNFRSYRNDSFEFEPGVNIIVGPNASGKTNLLEALLVVSLGSSYRARDLEIIKHGRPWARLDGHGPGGQRTIKIELTEGKTQKSFDIGGNPHKRLSLQKTLPVVLFEPDHLRLLTGSPERRREFLDDILSQVIPEFSSLRRQYKRALAQRNALLKNTHNKEQLFVWNVRLSELGGKIAQHRINLVERISKDLQKLYRSLAESKLRVGASYGSSCGLGQYGSNMLKKLEHSSELDFARGFTAYGPHRDDLLITLNGHPASEVGSRGEIRTLMLSLKLVELSLIEELRGQKPILLLDDVFSELDGARRRALTNYLSGYQTFITTTDADIVVQHFLDNCHIIPTSSF